MMRTAMSLAVLLVCGCADGSATETATATPAAAAGPHTTYPDKAFELTCGTEAIEVHFTDLEAHVSNPDGSISTLNRLPGEAAAYTNGRMTLTRSGDGTTISFARGRMATVQCTQTDADHQH